MKLVAAIFEDAQTDNFYPIALTKPVWELRSGCFSQRERFERFFSSHGITDIYYFTRDYLAGFYKEKYPALKINDYSVLQNKDVLFVNSRIIPDENIVNINKDILYTDNDIALACKIAVTQNDYLSIYDIIEKARTKEQTDKIAKYNFIWDIVSHNGERIKKDCAFLERKKNNNKFEIIGDKDNLYIDADVRIDPFVCIDVSKGPVVIGRGTIINSFTRIEGPCSIGMNCVILGAKIREGCSIGDNCRIGGEVEDSIFHANSNKYHDGFIGHSYIGEWVNLGAMTTNSDLKNNYESVSVYIPPKKVDTGQIKIGSFIGDFVKTSIGTLMTTGAVIGTGSMLIHAGKLSPYHVPPFTWFADNRIIDGVFFKDFIETCRTQTSRRNINFTDTWEKIFSHLYALTEDERKKELLKWKMQK